MPAHPLGEFYEGFSSFRRMLAKAPAENWPVVFANCVSEAVSYVGRGLDKVTAVDELVDMAASIGFADAEGVQRMLAEQFAELERIGEEVRGDRGNGPADEVDWDRLAEPDIDLNRDHDATGKPRTAVGGNVVQLERGKRAETPPLKLISKTSGAFIRSLQPPEYLIAGVLQRHFLYSFTGKTSSGKTAIALYLAACVALGRPLGELEVMAGHVLYLAGENPDDVGARWLAMSQQMDFDYDAIPVTFVPQQFKLAEGLAALHDLVTRIGSVALVVVDTAAAYFEGDEVNSNTQLGDYARRLRRLVDLPGRPAVLVPCHPVKRAADDDLIPLGAGSFLNEMDGNLTAAKNGTGVELHWQGKIRGPDFAPLSFELRTVTHEGLKAVVGATAGEPSPTVIARPISDAAREDIEKALAGDADLLLAEIKADPRASQADYGRRLGWVTSNGKLYKSKLSRSMAKLKAAKLITTELDRLVVTAKGEKYPTGKTQ